MRFSLKKSLFGRSERVDSHCSLNYNASSGSALLDKDGKRIRMDDLVRAAIPSAFDLNQRYIPHENFYHLPQTLRSSLQATFRKKSIFVQRKQ